MTSSDNDEHYPNEIPPPVALGPQMIEGTEPECNTLLIRTRQVDHLARHPIAEQEQSRHNVQQEVTLVPNSRQPLSREEDVDAGATTAAMSVASLEERPKSSLRMERENFLLFIKILFKVLEEDNDASARSRAQRIVMECRRRNQRGDPSCTPLMDGVERHLRAFIGEAKWRRSHLLLHHYVVTRREIPGVSSVTDRERPTAIMVGK